MFPIVYATPTVNKSRSSITYRVGRLVLGLVQTGGGAKVTAGHVVDVARVVKEHDLTLSNQEMSGTVEQQPQIYFVNYIVVYHISGQERQPVSN